MRKDLFALLTLSMLLFPLIVQAYDSPSISIIPLRYEPTPAQPGEYLQIWLNIENVGLGEAEDLVIVVEPEYPFYLDESETPTRELKTFSGLDNAIIDYKLRVASDAVEGENELTVKYSTGDRDVWVERKVTINIQTLDANLEVTKVESEEVSPGKTTTLKISMKNNADSYLRDVTVKLDLSTVPFLTIDSTSEKKIYIIESNKEKSVEYKLLISPSGYCQPYKIPINISYYDSTGELYTKSDYITLLVSSTPDIFVDLEESEIFTSGQVGEVILNVINKGLGNVKFLTVRLEEGNYDIISPSEIYIGNLNSDDFDSVTFKIFAGQANDTLPLKISLSYKDNNNVDYLEEKIVDLRLYSGEEISRYGLVPSADPTGFIILILAIAGIAYWYYKKKRKK